MVIVANSPPVVGMATAEPVLLPTCRFTLYFDGDTDCDAPATAIVAFPELWSTAANVTRGLFPPTGVIRPDTMTYNTAASTTVMATIRMVAITGDTAASSLRMTLFMV